jgi:hypothetical protein
MRIAVLWDVMLYRFGRALCLHRRGRKVTASASFLENISAFYQITRSDMVAKCCILYIFSATISTEYFKHAAHSPFFSSKCRLFHSATFLGSCIIHILHTECAKI